MTRLVALPVPVSWAASQSLNLIYAWTKFFYFAHADAADRLIDRRSKCAKTERRHQAHRPSFPKGRHAR
ncbi:hypothetical protein MPC1_7580002 [Methylocella tundrae]|nr:hypothetical protein MPC1_7580002 [Methylocella tundrae]